MTKTGKDRRVAESTLPDGKWVSTVRLPLMLDHRRFETMVFISRDSLDELDCDRYDTETDARAGHDEMVRKWSVMR